MLLEALALLQCTSVLLTVRHNKSLIRTKVPLHANLETDCASLHMSAKSGVLTLTRTQTNFSKQHVCVNVTGRRIYGYITIGIESE